MKFLFVQVQTFLRRDSVTALYLLNFFFFFFFLPPSIHCQGLLHPQPNIFIWNKLGHIWCELPQTTFWGKSFQLTIQQCALCSVLPLLWESGYASVSGFPLSCIYGRSFLLQGFRHKTVVQFKLSGQFLGLFGCLLKRFKGASSLPSICICHFHTACLFLPVLITPQNSIEGAQGKFKLQKMPNCV